MNLHKDIPQDELILDLDFNNTTENFNNHNITFKESNFKIPNSIIPHRVSGRFRCLPS